MLLENKLVNALPRRILAKLDKMFLLFEGDWEKIQKYLVIFNVKDGYVF